MDLSRVSEATKQRVLDALPGMTDRFADGRLRVCVEQRDLQGAIDRIEQLHSDYNGLKPQQRVTQLASGDAHYMDGLLASVILAGIERMLAINI